MSESDLARACVKWLNNQPKSFFFKIHGGGCQMVGISDLLGICNGRFVAIELKIGKNKPSKIQKWFLGEVVKCGGVGAVCWSLEDVKKIFRKE